MKTLAVILFGLFGSHAATAQSHVFTAAIVNCSWSGEFTCAKLQQNFSTDENFNGEEWLICPTQDEALGELIASKVKSFPIYEIVEGNTYGTCFTLYRFGTDDSSIPTPRAR